ncbi:hypothetical protein D3C80_2093770 [compost metagenome]
MRGFGKQAVYGVAEYQLEAKRHATRPTAHAARQIDEQRVLGIHCDALLDKLALQALGGHGIAEEQVA